jgi:hypothetical protein
MAQLRPETDFSNRATLTDIVTNATSRTLCCLLFFPNREPRF